MLNNIEIWVKGHSRSFEIAPFGRSHMRSYLAFHGNYGTCIISKIKQDIGRKLQFFIPLHSMRLLRVPRPNIVTFGVKKIRTVWLLLL